MFQSEIYLLCTLQGNKGDRGARGRRGRVGAVVSKQTLISVRQGNGVANKNVLKVSNTFAVSDSVCHVFFLSFWEFQQHYINIMLSLHWSEEP